ncbi:hypothetical protein FACS1894188_05560 [Clostridia bacterium]|nr:hypothetical protein FACS1894188_05560 [Clostridia bacterium]
MYTTKNYSTDGGDTLVIGGKLIIEETAEVTGLGGGNAPAAPVAEFQTDSTAEDTARLAADFNALLAKLKAAGLMASE